jgi:hypothetical protein
MVWVVILFVGGVYGPFWSEQAARTWLDENHACVGNVYRVNEVNGSK